jgi:uncharacterized damage-inducible protein DinB
MNINEALAAELKVEAATTRRLLERVPQDSLGWKPHDKSMTLGRLAGHVAEMPGLFALVLTEDVLDFASGKYQPFNPENASELTEVFDQRVAAALDALGNQPAEAFAKNWQMRNGERVLLEFPRGVALRALGLNHLIHHRGQLSVYLRLLDIAVPSIYGPSADDSAGF